MEKKNRQKNETKYLLHEHALQLRNILEIKEIFIALRSKIHYLQKRSSWSQGFQNVFNVRGVEKSKKEGLEFWFFSSIYRGWDD